MATGMMADGTAVVVVKDEKDFLLPESMPGLHSSMLPSFLTKTFEIVEDVETDGIVSWSMERNSLVVWDPYRFSSVILPRYFKHGNFSSFIRQLNTYGFRKVFPDRWEFAHEKFLSGQKHLLKDIKRRRNVGQSRQHKVGAGGSIDLGLETGFCAELGRFGFETELDRMKGDHSILVVEVERLKQQQQSSRTQILAMEEHIQGTERMQQRTAAFLARAFKNPLFVEQLLLQSEQKKQQLESLGRKRRLRAITSSEKVDNRADMMNPLSTIGKDGGTSNRDQNADAVLQSGGQDFGVIWEDFLDIGIGEGDQPEVEVEVEHQTAYQYDWIDAEEMVDDLVYIGSGP